MKSSSPNRSPTRVLFIDKGWIVEEGQPGDVIGNPREERTREFFQRLLVR